MISDPIPDDLFVLPSLEDVGQTTKSRRGAGGGKGADGRAAYSESPSDNVHLCTPERELAIVRAFAPIGLDPCSNPASTVGARVELWGPRPTCGVCDQAATHGHSVAAADRCEAHQDLVVSSDDDRVLERCWPARDVRVPDEILARYGGDGLAASWSAIANAPRHDEIVFLQPPYGSWIKPWIPKANAEAWAGAEIVGLLPGRFDTRWFNAMRPARICWYQRRIPYVDHAKPDQKDTAKFPSVFAYWGARAARFEEIFGAHGAVTGWR